jgi:hypothetical protein
LPLRALKHAPSPLQGPSSQQWQSPDQLLASYTLRTGPGIDRFISKARSCTKLLDLAGLVARQQQEQLTAAHCYAAIKQLPRLFHAADPSSADDASSKQAAAELLELLLEGLQGSLSEMQPHQQSHLITSILRSGLQVHASFLGRLMLTSLPKISQYSPRHLARMMYALARQGYRPPWQWMEAALNDVQCQAPLLCPQATAELMAAVALLECSPTEQWLEDILSASQQHLDDFTAQQLVSIIWALGKLQYEPEPSWADSFFAATQGRLAGMEAQWLAALLWALASLDADIPQDWALEMFACSEQWLLMLPPQELAAAAWAVAELQLQPPGSWMQQAARCMLRCRRISLPASPAPAAVTSSSTGGSRGRVTPELGLALTPPSLVSVPSGQEAASMLAPDALAALLWHLGKLEVKASAAAPSFEDCNAATDASTSAGSSIIAAEQLDAWLLATRDLLQHCSPAQLAAIAWGVASAQHEPDKAWLAALCAAVAGKAQQMTVAHMATVLSAVASITSSKFMAADREQTSLASSSPATSALAPAAVAPLQELLPGLGIKMAAADADAIANIWAAVAELRLAVVPEDLDAMLEATRARLQLLGSGHVSRVLYALALLRRVPYWVEDAVEQLVAHMDDCCADDLAVAVWSVAELGFVPSRAWLAATGARVQQVLPGCSAACRQQLLRALARVQARCEAAWQGLLEVPAVVVVPSEELAGRDAVAGGAAAEMFVAGGDCQAVNSAGQAGLLQQAMPAVAQLSSSAGLQQQDVAWPGEQASDDDEDVLMLPDDVEVVTILDLLGEAGGGPDGDSS